MLDEKIRKEYLFYVGRALRLAEKRYKQYSGSYMYDSIRNQLIYLYDVIANKKEDDPDTKVKIPTFTMGIISTREFSESDKIFDDRITSACYIADEIINGLKNKKLPDDHEDNPNYYKRQERLKKEYPDDYDV